MMTFLERIGVDRAVASLSVARMADALGGSLLVVVIPLYVSTLPEGDLQLPETVLVGGLISLYGLIFTIAQPFTGALSDRWNRRKAFIVVGLGVMMLSTFGFIYAGSYIELVILRAVQGIGVALTVPAALGVLAAMTDKSTRGGAMGFYTSARMLGFAAGPLIGGFLLVRYGFQHAYIVGAAVLFFSLLLVVAWVDEPVRVETGIPSPRYRILDRRIISGGVMFLGAAVFFMATSFSMMAALETDFNARLGLTAFEFGIAFSSLTVSRLIFQVPLGRLSDRYGRKGFIVAGLLLMAPVTALIGVAEDLPQLMILRSAQGFTAAAIAAPAFALAGDLSTVGGEAQQMSVLSMGFGLGLAIGPLLAGWLAIYAFGLPFLVSSFMLVLGAIVVYRNVPETIGRASVPAGP
jgi:MFS family permease